jgi:hypothetical protein
MKYNNLITHSSVNQMPLIRYYKLESCNTVK